MIKVKYYGWNYSLSELYKKNKYKPLTVVGDIIKETKKMIIIKSITGSKSSIRKDYIIKIKEIKNKKNVKK